jgi:hypothetical protein
VLTDSTPFYSDTKASLHQCLPYIEIEPAWPRDMPTSSSLFQPEKKDHGEFTCILTLCACSSED